MNVTFDESLLMIVAEILRKGQIKDTRTGIKTKSLFNRVVETPELGMLNLPISQIRKTYYKGAIIEALWILGIHQNDEKYRKLPFTNTQYLEDNKVTYWRPWQDENGDLGPVYGEQLCRWKKYQKMKLVMDEGDSGFHQSTINQIQNIIDTINRDKTSRRLVCSMWNPAEIEGMALPPCHYAFEFYIRNDPNEFYPRLDLRWIQRSCDMLIGLPYDVLIYAIIQKIVSLCTNCIPGKLYGSLGDCHVYENQIEQAKELIRRFHGTEYQKLAEKTNGLTFIELSDKIIEKYKNKEQIALKDFNPDGSDFKVVDYQSLEKLEIPVAV